MFLKESKKISNLYTEVQILDTKSKTKLPTGVLFLQVLLSPLHPIRLTWFMNLIDQFDEWLAKSLLI